MNPEVNIIAHLNKVGPESESTYDDDFFNSLDGVANALDNVEARKYMDRRCVYYRLPLLESGTHGTKGNVQVVVPFLTESYFSSHDLLDKRIPKRDTLENFPYTIEHTLQWARDTFECLFTQTPKRASYILKVGCIVPTVYECQHAFKTFMAVKKVLTNRPVNEFEQCVSWARNLWQDLFANQISQLLYEYPPANLFTTNGQAFWSAPKKLPTALTFDVENPLHLDFVLAAANLFAEVTRALIFDEISTLNISIFLMLKK
jgi:ubiquitin-activating enzyme E1